MAELFYSYKALKEKHKQELREVSEEETLIEQVASMFEYENMETVDARFIELYLLLFGKCAIWRHEGNLIVSYCMRASTPNVNGEGKDLICSTWNGTVKQFKDFETSNEVAYIRNNMFDNPDWAIPRTAELLGQLDKSILHNIINSRYTPIVIARDSKAKTAIETALKENNAGAPQVVLSDNIFDENKELVLNITDVNAQDKIQYLNHAVDDIIRRFFNTYGVDTCGASKQAQQSIEEINSGCNSRLIVPNDRLYWRKKGLERANEIFGTNFSVKFSEAWEREFERVQLTKQQEAEETSPAESEEAEDENV